MSALRWLARAIGIGRADKETLANHRTKRPYQKWNTRYFHLNSWGKEMRFGWVLSWQGFYWMNAIGLVGPEWNDGRWLGGKSWRRHGPFVICRYRYRGSLKYDRWWARLQAGWAAEDTAAEKD